MKAPKIIAEIGCNHKGDMAIAREMIMTAATYCKVDVVKFQKRCNKELLTPEEYNAPHPHPENSYGDTYGKHREFLEFTIDQHRQLQEWCNEYGIEYSTSVWDVTSAKEICSLKPNLIKVPSACNLTLVFKHTIGLIPSVFVPGAPKTNMCFPSAVIETTVQLHGANDALIL